MSAADLRRAAARFYGPAGLPRLWFFTDPERTPDPLTVASTLPAGSAVVYRHFGASDRRRVAQRLQRLCARRRLCLLIGADPDLASEVGARGVHLPERLTGAVFALRQSRPDWIVSAAAHSAAATLAPANAIVLSSIYASRSASADRPLGLMQAARIARACPSPVIALGGVSLARMAEVARAGFAGVAGIDLFLK